MPTDHRAQLAKVKTFRQLIAYLRDEMGWPIARDSFEDVDDLFYDFTADELGIDPKTAAKIQEIKRLRPLSPKQPWGIFFVKFEPKKLPVVALRRILSQVALKKRASANSAERAAWAADDLLFVSNYGEGEERQISFAHFTRAHDGHDLPTLKVLGWNNRDTALHLDAVARELTEHLAWPDDEADDESWRTRWRAAFTLRHREVVTTSKELSIRLAELARNIRDRIRTALAIETDKGPLTKLMKAFQEALVHDLDADGFADMYAQTIAYGLLSARIADPHKKTADDFAAHMRTNPFLGELMETFLKVGGRHGKAGGPGIDFDELGVSEVVELLDDANMEAVVLDFGDRNRQEDPVIHFYELFLKEYDAKKRMQRGVFYTPRPVVSYIVRSVDELLRTEFGLADGLADTTTWGEMARRHKDLNIPEGVSPDQDFVQILDPATGTGTFLVEVIDLVHKTLVAKWKAQGNGEKKIDVLWNEYVPKHLLTRLHGYELLMAPYAIAHLKIGLKLYETGYHFASDERARVYLTNALEPAQDFSGRFQFAIPALAHEAQAVNTIKEYRRFTVVIGNPPYSVSSWNTGEWITYLAEDYKRTVRAEESQIQSLSNDYIKFLRFGEWHVERTSTGLLGLITGHGYLSGTQPRDLRNHLSRSFDRCYCLDLHGSLRRAGPHDSVDEPVFEIMTGVAIFVGCRVMLHRQRAMALLESLTGVLEKKFAFLSAHTALKTSLGGALHSPCAPNYHFAAAATSQDISEEYQRWPALPAIFGTGSRQADKEVYWATGFASQQDQLAMSFTREEVEDKMAALTHSRSFDELQKSYRICTTNQWNYGEAKEFAKRGLWKQYVGQVAYRPFDRRWTVLHKHVLTILRKQVMSQLGGTEKNVGLISSRAVNDLRFAHCFVTNEPVDKIFISSKTSTNAYVFPLFFRHEDILGKKGRPNFSQTFLTLLAERLGVKTSIGDGLPNGVMAEDIFHYAYAVFHSPSYRSRYAEFLKIDFPRLPLTGNLDLFRALTQLGGETVALHLLESPKLDRPLTEFVGGRNPEVEKVSWSKNTVWIDKAQTTGFKGVREDVWTFHIGGYQVCEKWLKDRKGRKLLKDDIAHYQKIVVSLNETIRLIKEIDEVIEQHGGWPGAFQTGEAKAATAKVLPFRPVTVEPKPEERYVTCVPLVPLKAAAGTFGDPQHIEDDDFEWVVVESSHRLRPKMFVAQVVGKSMEPAIPDGAWCLFRAAVEGTRQDKTVLVQLRDTTDPETGQRYTIKRYESKKSAEGDSWRHEQITLRPLNPDFEPIVLTDADECDLHVIAELVEVLGIDG
jgi:type I restriction-modification system DNA methylase subunit/SOS-response transcriptional repressor LexA